MYDDVTILSDDLPMINIIPNENHAQSIARIRGINGEVLQRLIQPRFDRVPTRVKAAFEYAKLKADHKQMFGQKEILQVHRLLGEGDRSLKNSGKIREPSQNLYDGHRVGVGNYVTPPEGQDLDSLLKKYVQRCCNAVESSEILTSACIAYYLFGLLHPFYDGNGRTGRVLCSWMLMLYGYPHVAVNLEEKWGNENPEHAVACNSGKRHYLACLGNRDIETFLNYRFVPYFLAKVEELLNEIKYKDRDGKEIDAVKCAELMQNSNYKEIGVDQVGPFFIFTEWKGQLHIPTGAFFETTIHPSDLYPSAVNEKR